MPSRPNFTSYAKTDVKTVYIVVVQHLRTRWNKQMVMKKT